MSVTPMPSCTVQRRVLIQHSTLYLPSGLRGIGSQEWVTQACGKPLFEDAEIAAGKCRSCLAGWTHPENYPVQQSPMSTPDQIPESVRDDILALAASYSRNKAILLKALRAQGLPDSWLLAWDEKLERLRVAVQLTTEQSADNQSSEHRK